MAQEERDARESLARDRRWKRYSDLKENWVGTGFTMGWDLKSLTWYKGSGLPNYSETSSDMRKFKRWEKTRSSGYFNVKGIWGGFEMDNRLSKDSGDYTTLSTRWGLETGFGTMLGEQHGLSWEFNWWVESRELTCPEDYIDCKYWNADKSYSVIYTGAFVPSVGLYYHYRLPGAMSWLGVNAGATALPVGFVFADNDYYDDFDSDIEDEMSEAFMRTFTTSRGFTDIGETDVSTTFLDWKMKIELGGYF